MVKVNNIHVKLRMKSTVLRYRLKDTDDDDDVTKF